MALIICSECGKEVSDKAGACPHCGCPRPEMKKGKKRNNLVVIKLPKVEEIVDDWMGMLLPKKVRITADTELLWEGNYTQEAIFEITEPKPIHIDLGLWGRPVEGVVGPGRKYKLVQELGFHIRANFRLCEVED